MRQLDYGYPCDSTPAMGFRLVVVDDYSRGLGRGGGWVRMAGNGGYWDVMEVARVGRGGSQSQGGAWGQAKGRCVECGAPKGGLWVAVRAR